MSTDALGPPVKLLPGERIENVEELDLRDPEKMPDALEELCKLTGVERAEDIGQNGPAVGARVTEANAGEPALRLFEVVFGRDSLTVAMVVGDLFPKLSKPRCSTSAASRVANSTHSGKRSPGASRTRLATSRRTACGGSPTTGPSTRRLSSSALRRERSSAGRGSRLRLFPGARGPCATRSWRPSPGFSGGSRTTTSGSRAPPPPTPTGSRTPAGKATQAQ